MSETADSKYSRGEILIDPTPRQRSALLRDGLNPDAGPALLRQSRLGKLSSIDGQVNPQDLVLRAWEQLAKGVGVDDVSQFDQFTLESVPSELGLMSEFEVS